VIFQALRLAIPGFLSEIGYSPQATRLVLRLFPDDPFLMRQLLRNILLGLEFTMPPDASPTTTAEFVARHLEEFVYRDDVGECYVTVSSLAKRHSIFIEPAGNVPVGSEPHTDPMPESDLPPTESFLPPTSFDPTIDIEPPPPIKGKKPEHALALPAGSHAPTLLPRLMKHFQGYTSIACADLDTGTGEFVPAFTALLRQTFRHVRGVGVEMLGELAQQTRRRGIKVLHATPEVPGDYKRAGLHDRTQDIVTINNIESRPSYLIDQADRLLKPGGLVVVTFERGDMQEGNKIDEIVEEALKRKGYQTERIGFPSDYPHSVTYREADFVLLGWKPPQGSGVGPGRTGVRKKGVQVIPTKRLMAVALPWAEMVGGADQAERLISLDDEAQDQRLRDTSQPIVMLVKLTQLTEDPLLSLLLEAMRQRNYFATQGGAVSLVFVDAQARDEAEAITRTEQTLTGVNTAHHGATQLSRALASAVLAGEATAEALARIAQRFDGTPVPVVRVGSRPSEPAVAEGHAVVFAPALRAALDIASAAPQERAGVAATMQTHYGVTVARGPSALVPYLPLPTVVPVPVQMEQQLRTFRRTASSG